MSAFFSLVLLAGCEAPVTDASEDHPTFKEWVDTYLAEDGMYCDIWRACNPDYVCEDLTETRLNASCESMYEPYRISACLDAYDAHMESPSCEFAEYSCGPPTLQ